MQKNKVDFGQKKTGKKPVCIKIFKKIYSTVTDFARFRG